MLTAPPPIEAAASPRWEELLPRWRELPIYQARLPQQPLDSLSGVPFLTKRDMRGVGPSKFLRPDQVLEQLLEEQRVELDHTSGTSEERLAVLLGHGWWDEQERRALCLNPLIAELWQKAPPGRRVQLTIPACNATTCPVGWRSVAQRTHGSTLSVNLARLPFLVSDGELDRMAEETLAWAPQFLDLDPVHGAWFALHCERRGLRFPSLRFVIVSYEFVSQVHRRILERVFQVPVLNLYGSTETGHLLMESAPGIMVPSTKTAWLEVVETDQRGLGELVVTTLSNDFMPLVRYRIGDWVMRTGQGPTARYVVHGRGRDALRAGDGRRVTTWDVDQCFSSLPAVAHYELRQASDGQARLRYVPDGPGPSPQDLAPTLERLQDLLQQPAPIVCERVPFLLPALSGKFRLTHPA